MQSSISVCNLSQSSLSVLTVFPSFLLSVPPSAACPLLSLSFKSSICPLDICEQARGAWQIDASRHGSVHSHSIYADSNCSLHELLKVIRTNRHTDKLTDLPSQRDARKKVFRHYGWQRPLYRLGDLHKVSPCVVLLN